ncbi:MAG: phytanoyl-CoA dioxygenase family protein [Candidatus Neomarinimicrobiota bacterium]
MSSLNIVNKRFDLEKDGFCFLPIIYSKEDSISARNGLWRVINGKYDTGKLPENRFWEVGDSPNKIIKIDKPHLCNDEVWNLITNEYFGKLLAKVTRAKKIQVWHSQVVWKPKSEKNSGNAGWHRDAQYWPFWSSEGLFTAWIALSNVSSKSGPVRFISGSNHWDNLDGMDFFDKNLITQNNILKQHHKKIKIINGTLDMGQVSIHSSLTYHSSGANLETKPRVGMVVHFCTDKAKRVQISGENSKYLDQIMDLEIAPIIYENNTHV